MTMRPPSRRGLLGYGGALSMLGAAAPFAWQLAAAGSAASQSAPDYKALVCVFLFGGNDAHNMVLATDTDSWGRYFRTRNTGQDPIALMPVGTPPTAVGQTSPVTGRVAAANTPEAWGGVLPITPATPQAIPAGTTATAPRTFALHPFLGPLQSLFNQGRLAVVANVGTLINPVTKAQYQARSVPLPANLFSHNDQQSVWQAGAAEGARRGWGGRLGDMIASANGGASLFTAVSTAGNAVFLAGQNVIQYQVSTSGQPALSITSANGATLFGSSVGPARMRDIIQDSGGASLMGADYATTVTRSIASVGTINTAYAQPIVTGVASPTPYVNAITGNVETNSLAVQLQTVARLIAAAPSLGVTRQVFFVSLGGWDTHDFQNTTQPNLLAKVAHGLAYFDTALGNIGGTDRRASVTTFTASDFSRTFNTNGDGTDHAWGGHQFVMGGAVRGRDMYGQYPTLGVDVTGFNNPNNVGNAVIPTTSVDQFAATMGAWLGVADTDLASIFPNLRNFARPNLGFV
ncbi:DUF1501 domain-containing protein [Phenylobacterium sp.]|uniref:DUF1501 domain-containing protein n=1 Tax=Phenylobacterium sp. TaxID=1871053 RepID=UPI003982F94C